MKNWDERWMRGLPAVVVGGVAALLTAYGYWFLPARLPSAYERQLTELREEYDEVAERSSLTRGNRLLELGAELDIVYQRLIELEDGAPERRRRWAEFHVAHASALQAWESDPATSGDDATRQQAVQQAARSWQQAFETYQQLASGGSKQRVPATLWLADRAVAGQSARWAHAAKLSAGELLANVERLAELLDIVVPSRLAGMMDYGGSRDQPPGLAGEPAGGDEHSMAPEATGERASASELEPAERRHAALRFAQLGYRLAWAVPSNIRSAVRPEANRELLQTVWREVTQYRPTWLRRELAQLTDQQDAWGGDAPELADRPTERPQWRAVAVLLLAELQPEVALRLVAQPVVEAVGGGPAEDDMPSILAELQLECAARNWRGLLDGFQWQRSAIGRQVMLNESQQRWLGAELASTYARLVLGPWGLDGMDGSDGLGQQLASGLLPAVQLDFGNPDVAAVIWQLVCEEAGKLPAGEPPRFNEEFRREVFEGELAEPVRQALQALAAELRGEREVAERLQRMCHESSDASSRELARLLSQLGWWYAQRGERHLETWDAILTRQTELAPNDGLAWLAGGLLQLKHGDRDQARERLERAAELLPDIELVEELTREASGESRDARRE